MGIETSHKWRKLQVHNTINNGVTCTWWREYMIITNMIEIHTTNRLGINNNKTTFFINKKGIHDNKRKNNGSAINRQNSSSLKLLTCLLRIGFSWPTNKDSLMRASKSVLAYEIISKSLKLPGCLVVLICSLTAVVLSGLYLLSCPVL